MSPMRELAIALLNDKEGISERAYDLLSTMLSGEDGNEDILEAVEATDERFYLPEDWTPAPVK